MSTGMDNIEKKLDSLREIFNIGVGGAATALNKIIKIPVMITVPEVAIMPIDGVLDYLGPADKRVVSIYVRISDNFPAGILLVLDEDSAKQIVRLSSVKSCDCMEDERFISVLKEVANIMCSYFLNNFSKFIKMPLMPSVPEFAVDMSGAILDCVILNYHRKNTDILLVKTELYNQQEKFFFNFMLIPESESLKVLLEKI
jgi:chemotaxis protein CheC